MGQIVTLSCLLLASLWSGCVTSGAKGPCSETKVPPAHVEEPIPASLLEAIGPMSGDWEADEARLILQDLREKTSTKKVESTESLLRVTPR